MSRLEGSLHVLHGLAGGEEVEDVVRFDARPGEGLDLHQLRSRGPPEVSEGRARRRHQQAGHLGLGVRWSAVAVSVSPPPPQHAGWGRQRGRAGGAHLGGGRRPRPGGRRGHRGGQSSH